jgi:type VI secretion system secreted protein VgrG
VFVQDYNYRTPLLDPTASTDADADGMGGIVEYGNHVKSPEEAARVAQIRAQELLARKRVLDGKSSHPTLSAGRRVALLDHPRLEAEQPLLVTEVVHEAHLPLANETGRVEAGYRNTFRAITEDVVFRPARRTARPRMPGVVTGVIQPGSAGEIGGVAKLDPSGRYIVQFHFDTAPHRDGSKASHPVRMAQPFAGHGNGMHFPLLPGTEVLIAFANGDPDRPVIVGAVPNPVSPAPVVAAEAHTHRIRSSQGVTIEFGRTVPGRS